MRRKTTGNEDNRLAARDLMRRSGTASLATTMVGSAGAGSAGAGSAGAGSAGAGSTGWAYASLVTVAWDCDASPILLLSDLADHTHNLEADPRASLLVEAASRLANPQSGPRVSLMGRLARTGEARHGRRFLARHPDARQYAHFNDFHFHRMSLERGRFVGGFARAAWIEGPDLVFDGAASAAMAACETAVIEHMNRDHRDAVRLYANALLGRRGKDWKVTGVDPEGIDLRLGRSFARLRFDGAVHDAAACRAELVRLAKKARELAAR